MSKPRIIRRSGKWLVLFTLDTPRRWIELAVRYIGGLA